MPDTTDTLTESDTTTEAQAKPWERFAVSKAASKPWERFAAPPPPKPANYQLNPLETARLASFRTLGTTSPEQAGFEQYQAAHPLTPEQIAGEKYGELRPLTGLERLNLKKEQLLNKIFPGYAEKATPSPFNVVGQAAMIAPLGVPERLGKLMLAYFGAQTASQQPELLRQIHDEIKSGNYSDAKKLAIEDVLNLGILASSGASLAHQPIEPATAGFHGPLATGAILRTPTGATPPPEPELGPFTLPGRGLTQTIGDIRFPRQKPQVPETPAEPYQTSVEEIRRANARTIADIQKLFPKAELSREQARVLRNTAWAKAPTEPATQQAYAETIRGHQTKLPQPGQVTERGEEARRHDLQQIAPQPPESVGTRKEQAPESGVPLAPPTQGNVRLYSGGGSSWFTTNPERAASFGAVRYVDVPKDVFEQSKPAAKKESGTPGDVVLPNHWVNRAAPIPVAPTVHELGEVETEPEAPLTVPEPTPEQLARPEEKLAAKGNPKPQVSPRYFRAAGSATADPNWWMDFFKKFTAPGSPYNQQSIAYQVGAYLRQLGNERALPVIDALWKSHANMRQRFAELPVNQEKINLGISTQFIHEALQAAHDVGSAKGEVPESAGKPLTEKIYQAAYQPREGVTESGPHHPGILKRLGVSGFETRESRNTPQFGYKTTGREFVERPEGAEIAKAAKQQLEPFEVDETGQPQAHSDEIKSATEPGKTVSEQEPTPETAAAVEPSTVPQGTEAAPVAKIQSEVQKVARTEGQRPAGEIKDELITELEQKFYKAPTEAKPGDKVTIEIPGDGIFTISNDKASISAVLQRAKKLKTHPGKVPPVPPAAVKFSSKAISQMAGENERIRQAQAEIAAKKKNKPVGTELGFGATRRPQPTTPPSAPSKVPPPLQGLTQVGSIQTLHQNLAAGTKNFVSVIGPTLLNKTAAESGRIVSRMAAERDLKIAQVDAAVHKARNEIDKLPTDQKYQFWQDWENGVLSQNPLVRAAQETIRKELDLARDELIKRGLLNPDSIIDDKEFLSRVWTQPDQARDFFAQMAGRRPLRGDRGYLKQRTLEWFMDGIKAGLKPVDDNVFFVQQERLRSMWKYISSTDGIQREDDAGRLRFKRVFEQMPVGYARVDDPAFRVFGPPTEVLKEWVDKHIYEGLLNVAKTLGIQHERKYGLGGKRLGYSVVGRPEIKTRFGSETSVLAHELGHQLDERYDLWDRIHREAVGYGRGGKVTKSGSQKQRVIIDKELRAIADLTGMRGAKGYVYKKEEKIAQMIESYIHAPERMNEVAPHVYNWLDKFFNATPELKPLAELKPGIELTQLNAQKAHGGLLQYGEYVLPTDSARIWNNFIGRGLAQFGWYRGARSTGNFMLSLRLVGGFHPGFVALETPINTVSLAMWHASLGNYGKALTTALQAPTAPASFFIEGARVKKILLNPDRYPQYAMLHEWLVRAGGGVGTDPVWKFEAARSMRRSFRQSMEDFNAGRIVKGFVEGAFGTLKLPPAAVEKIMQPIFDSLVPNMKLGAWSRLASERIEAAGGWDKLTTAEQDRILSETWTSIDNRFGLLRYANLHWNPIFKDAAQLTVQSVGWNLGYREFVGAGYDVGKTFTNFARGKGWQPTERMMYPLAVAIVTGAIGGTLTWLLTGHRPKNYMDFMHPDTGQKDQRGQEIRLNLPTYWKDLEHWRKDPVGTLSGKLHPLGSTVAELYRNRDWYGVQIYPPYGPASEKIKDILAFLAKAFEPYTIQNIDRLRERGLAWPVTLSSIVGVTPVPRKVEQSPAEETLSRIVESKRPIGGYTSEQETMFQKRREALKEIEAGKLTPAAAAAQGMIPHREIRHYARVATRSYLQNNIARPDVTIPEAMAVWDRATADERKSIKDILRHRIFVASNLTKDEKRFLLDKINRDATPTKP